MKRLDREPGKMEVLNLFAALGRQHGFTLGDKRSEAQFLESVSASLISNKDNQSLLHGFRTEDLFQYVAASLDKCLLIKKEDIGEPIAISSEMQPPDYQLVLQDKSRLFVEVKNCHKKQPPCLFTLKSDYVHRLIQYSNLFDTDLRIAIYWSAWNIWTLVSLKEFDEINGKYKITIFDAVKSNEMNTLGDTSIGTTPPLILRFIADKTKPHSIDDEGLARFTIGKIEFRCGANVIIDKTEQRFAFYFMLYGDWYTGAPKAIIEDNKLVAIDYIAEPETTTPGQGFEIIGAMSSLISRRYQNLVLTSSSGERISISAEPASLGLMIPEDYKGKALPLWIFHIQPNLKKQP
jgi:hypothetical protein